jgi:hypothetical protein
MRQVFRAMICVIVWGARFQNRAARIISPIQAKTDSKNSKILLKWTKDLRSGQPTRQKYQLPKFYPGV